MPPSFCSVLLSSLASKLLRHLAIKLWRPLFVVSVPLMGLVRFADKLIVCQAWTTSYQLTPFIALLDLRAPWGWQQREENESGGVECRRIDKIKSSEYMSEYSTIYT
jgi:hypothetical protein